jgi:hypothetical protein
MRKYLIGAVLGVVASVALSGVASASTTSLIWTASATNTKQSNKTPGGIGFSAIGTADVHSGVTVPPGGPGCIPPATVTPACKYFPPSVRTVVTFDPDVRFDPNRIPDCNVALLTGKDAAGARAACPNSIVGTGTSHIHTLTETNPSDGGPGTLVGTITAFNSQPSGGAPTIALHVDIDRSTTSPILTGTLNANVLSVLVPVTPGTVIEDFSVALPKTVSSVAHGITASAAKKKKKKKQTFYVSAKCSDGSWDSSATVTYQDGSSLTDTFSQPCQRAKTKKKKKK